MSRLPGQFHLDCSYDACKIIAMNYEKMKKAELIARLKELSRPAKSNPVEKALKEQEEEFGQFFEEHPEYCYLVSPDGTILDLNPAALKVLGYDKKEIVGKPLKTVYAPESLPKMKRLFAKWKKAGQLRNEEMVVLTKSGEKRTVLLSAGTARDENGRILHSISVQRDITDRKQVQEALRLAHAELEQILQTMAGGMRVIDKNFTVQRVNDTLVALTGVSREEAVGRKCYESFEGPLCHTPDCILARILNGEKRIEREIEKRRKDGGRVPCYMTATPFHSPYGELVGIVEDFRDITELKQAEEELKKHRDHLEELVGKRTAALRKSEASLAEAQRIAHLGSWDWDIVNNTLWWSDEIYRIFGLTPQEFGATYEAFLNSVHPDDRESVKEAVNRALHKDEPYGIDHRVVLPDGSERIVHEQAGVFHDEDGRAVRMVGTVQDITERRQLEGRLLQAQKMEAIGRLTGGIAHDFNNLLVVIGGRARRALKGLKEDDPLRKELEQVIRAEESASSLTRQLLAFGRKQVLKPQVLNLNKVLSDMEMMLRRLIGEDIAFLMQAEPDLGYVEADPSQIEQVVMNLAVNARDAMPTGGRLTVRTSNIHLGGEHPGGYLAPPGDYVMLEVSDTGCGMDRETLSHIFEPFFTTKAPGEGTGLGLATVYGIVRQSGGDIRVYSEPGMGTTFKMYLPQVQESALPGISEIPEEEGSLCGTETILLVEDEDMVREFAALELRDLGYTVLEAANGSEALKVCEQHRGQIHLVMTDVVMPGMNGPDMFKLLAEKRPGIEVLYCSGYAEQDILKRGILDQGKAFIEKPFTAEALGRKVREVLSG